MKHSFPRVTFFALSLALAANAQVYVRIGPPPPPHEVIVPRPSARHIWVPGYHRWDGRRYEWVPGRWVVPPPHRHEWVAGHWRNTPHGWMWAEGHWR